ncbi:MAG TPA: alpha/beta hydrolase [Tepidisphaeraceae bacterium]
MVWSLSLVLCGVYLLLPAAGIGLFALRGRGRLKRQIAGGFVSGMLLASSLLVIYTLSVGGRIPLGDVLLTLYLGVGLMLMLRLFDAGIHYGVFRLLRAGDAADPPRWRVGIAAALRVALFALIGLPWVMAALMTYRPHVLPLETPRTMLAASFERVEFHTADGVRVAAWYVPAAETSDVTVLLCHGLGASKDGMWPLAQKLRDSGANLLAIDLRAHGESGGRVTSYGAGESNDAVAAADWLKAHRSAAARRVIGVGASLGGAALVRAAAASPEIDAVAVLGSYDDLGRLAVDLSANQFVRPLGWLVRKIALPIASLHAGHDLRSVRPAAEVARIWPRPVLVVHGTGDEIIPFDRGRALFDAATPPRRHLWIDSTHNGVLDDPRTIEAVVDFAKSAESVPVI